MATISTHKFTFQYGSIQIESELDKYLKAIGIYIPIWFYSNNLCNLKAKIDNQNLHSNMVLFKFV